MLYTGSSPALLRRLCFHDLAPRKNTSFSRQERFDSKGRMRAPYEKSMRETYFRWIEAQGLQWALFSDPSPSKSVYGIDKAEHVNGQLHSTLV